MTRYIGLDVHDASTTMVVVGPSGKKICQHVVETNAKVLIDLLKSIPRPRHLCIEEGTHSAWLYEVLSPHVDETVVTVKTEKRGMKNDERDALGFANKLRTNSIEKRVYKEVGQYGKLRDLARVHRMQVRDATQLKNRISSMFRSRAIAIDPKMYREEHREVWIRKLPVRMRVAVNQLMIEHDRVEPLRLQTERLMVAEARKHRACTLLQTVPGIGPIRASELMAIIVSPHRFRTRRQLWRYAGLGIVVRSSSDWVHHNNGSWSREQVQQTRGLNRDLNAVLKHVFKSAAKTVVTSGNTHCPLHQHYRSLLERNTKPNLAALTIARQIAAICLAVWKKEVPFDPAMVSKHT